MKTAAVLVLVTAQNGLGRNIKTGKDLAEKIGAPLRVLNIQSPDTPAAELAGNIEKLYTIAKSCGADITIYYDKNPASAVARHIQEQGASHIVAGFPGGGADGGFLTGLRGLVPEIPLTVVNDEGSYTILATRGAAKSLSFCGKAGVLA